MFYYFRSYEIVMNYSNVRNYQRRPMLAGPIASIPEYLYSDRLKKRSHQSRRLPSPRDRSTVAIKAC